MPQSRPRIRLAGTLRGTAGVPVRIIPVHWAHSHLYAKMIATAVTWVELSPSRAGIAACWRESCWSPQGIGPVRTFPVPDPHCLPALTDRLLPRGLRGFNDPLCRCTADVVGVAGKPNGLSQRAFHVRAGMPARSGWRRDHWCKCNPHRRFTSYPAAVLAAGSDESSPGGSVVARSLGVQAGRHGDQASTSMANAPALPGVNKGGVYRE